MENFEKYFIEESLLDQDIDEYLIVDSDTQIENPEKLEPAHNNKNIVLAEHDINIQHLPKFILSQPSKMLNRNKTLEKGKLSTVLMGRRQDREAYQILQEQITKTEAQCSALELLIQNAIKKEAELIVLKKKIARKMNNRNERKQNKEEKKQRPQQAPKSRDNDEFLTEFDIKKTVKTGIKHKNVPDKTKVRMM